MARKHYKEVAIHKHPKDVVVVQYHKDHKAVVLGWLALPLSVTSLASHTVLKFTQDEYQNYKSYIRTAMKCTCFCRNCTSWRTTFGALIDEWGGWGGAHTWEVWCIADGCRSSRACISRTSPQRHPYTNWTTSRYHTCLRLESLV